MKTRGYIICATPRTGSTLLCGLLADTKIAGCPDSFFMRGVDPVWAERWGLPDRAAVPVGAYDAAFLKAIISAGKGRTGVFGLRLMRETLDDATAMLRRLFPQATGGKALLEAAFGPLLFIHLAREDKLAQAISFVKAEQTGLWHRAADGTELERLGLPQEPVYDFSRIARQLAELEAHDAAWHAWFQAQGIAPMHIGYETLAARPAETLGSILGALGLPSPSSGGANPGVARLADDVSLEWMRRFELDSERAAQK